MLAETLSTVFVKANTTDYAVIAATSLAALYVVYNKTGKRSGLNEPPKVAYSLPFVGHTLYLAINSQKFLDWCGEKYGEAFDLDILGKRTTCVSGKTGEEALKADASDLSLKDGILTDPFHLDYVLSPTTFEIAFKVNPLIARSVIPQSKMPLFTSDIRLGTEQAFKELIGDLSKGPKEIKNLTSFFQDLVAYISVRALLGSDAVIDDVIKSFSEFTGDVTNNVGLFKIVPQALHKYIIPYVQSLHRHQGVMREGLAEIMEKRRKLTPEDFEKTGQRFDFLQGLIEYRRPDGTGYTNDELAEAVLLLAFASVHTTSMHTGFVIFWLLARPDIEVALRKEIDEHVGDGEITDETLKDMKLLESVIRESVRQGADMLGASKMALRDFSFSNGIQIPKGRLINVQHRQLNFGANANNFDLKDYDPLTPSKKLASQVSSDLTTFGLGKHMCPGRFFAVHEIKIITILLLRNYNIRAKNGKPSFPVEYILGMYSAPSSQPVVIEARQ